MLFEDYKMHTIFFIYIFIDSDVMFPFIIGLGSGEIEKI